MIALPKTDLELRKVPLINDGQQDDGQRVVRHAVQRLTKFDVILSSAEDVDPECVQPAAPSP